MKNTDKTNVMRILDGKKISYVIHTYEPDATMSGEEIFVSAGKVGFQIELSPEGLAEIAGCGLADIV